ncbi:hypothetical protein LCGC14_1175630 [marine sediment metagenome]|uniref:Uncharacterized protein n=1 Tax=marine sediment metagenome TaxID=412755 RepID=A0A0F9LTH2_9ZZZZ
MGTREYIEPIICEICDSKRCPDCHKCDCDPKGCELCRGMSEEVSFLTWLRFI